MYGPIQVDSISSVRYFVTYINDHSRKIWTYLINRKDDVFEVFKKFKPMIERQSGHKLKVLKIDSGGEYASKDIERFYDEEGIVHEVVTPYRKIVLVKGRTDQS